MVILFSNKDASLELLRSWSLLFSRCVPKGSVEASSMS